MEQRATIERLLSSFVVLEKEVETLRDANHKEAALKEIAVAKLQVITTHDKMPFEYTLQYFHLQSLCLLCY